ncbi:MAG: flagellar basal body P-ring formation protein FlgA [Planctomycetes bacterium]|nr:flagellar basal body P-ring formation protein FlgA [Planctomycetota bacterium]
MNERRHGCWMTVATALSALCAASSARGGEIRIWPTATVSSESIRLSDVAQVSGFDDERARVLREIAISAAPREGGDLQVGTADVRGALTESGVNLADVQLLGASRCKVSRTRTPFGTTLRVRPIEATSGTKNQPHVVRTVASNNAPVSAANTLESALKQFIVARLGEKDAGVEIRFSPTSKRDLQLDGNDFRFDIHARDESKLGLITLEVGISPARAQTQSDGPIRTVPIIAEVSVMREVVVARRSINRGEMIEGRHLKLEQRRFTDYSQIGLTDVAAVVGQQARQFVKAGEMLIANGVEGRPLVQRGDAVTIWIKQGPLVIKASGRAQEAGVLGEKITVARDGSRRKQDIIDAVVTGPSTVTLGSDRQVAMNEREAGHE